ncbi:MAG: hypothetical protein GY731_08145, partial [Gammaproteobacteria bacterium]|nr:hypothetical protein [Gammaproteobacteria bacterium]
EPPVSSDEAASPEDKVALPTTRRVAYKTLLAATVIGVITISVLWTFVIRPGGDPLPEVPIMGSEVQVQGDTVAKELPTIKTDPAVESIGRGLASLSGRIERGFEVQQTHNSVVKGELTAMAESIRTITAAIAALGETNQELGRRISEATSRLGMIIKEVRALKVTKRKPAIRHKPSPSKTPPFQIDAIDVWDDLIYVAVSRAGRVAFLQAGGQ